MQENRNPTIAEMQTGTMSPSASRGAWVTLHMLPTVNTPTVLGYMTGAESGMLKLTKFVIKDTEAENSQGMGIETSVHEGVWLINPSHVWMIEHEKTIPTPGFVPYRSY